MSRSSSNDGSGGTTRPRWRLVTFVTVLGAVVVGIPFALSEWTDPAFGTKQSLASTALINIGTTLLLAAVLVWLGRRFVSQAEGTARQVVEEQTKEFRTETAELRQRLEALQGRVAERTADVEAAGASILTDIVGDISFETVTKSLELANDIEALWHGAIAVPITDSVDAPAVRLSWAYAQKGGRFDSTDNLVPTLAMDYENRPEKSNKHFDFQWRQGFPADELIYELKEWMVKLGFGEAAQVLDAEYLFKRFGDGVTDAIAAKRGLPGAWLKDCGLLDELVGPNLAITSFGVAARDHGLVIESSDFPARRSPAMSAEQRSNLTPYKLPERSAPEGVDAGHWNVALKRAAEYHPTGQVPTAVAFYAKPYLVTSRNTPIHRD